MKDQLDYRTNCLAMAIVNHTNETNAVDVETRQKNNDMCFDFAVNKIKEFISYQGEKLRSIIDIGGRRNEKTLTALTLFQEAIEKGKNALYVGPGYVVMSDDNYQKLIRVSKEQEAIFVDESSPLSDSIQSKLFTEEEIESCNQPTK